MKMILYIIFLVILSSFVYAGFIDSVDDPFEQSQITTDSTFQGVFTRPAYNDLKLERVGDKLNITFGGKYFTLRGGFFYENEVYSFSQAIGYGVELDAWVNYNTGTISKFGGSVNLSNAPQVIKDNGYYVVFGVDGMSEGLDYYVCDDSLCLDNGNVKIVWKDYNNPSNKFQIYNKTVVYLTDNGSKFHDSFIYDPQVEVGNVSVGVYNYTAAHNNNIYLNNYVALGDYVNNAAPNSVDNPYDVYVDTTEKIAYVTSTKDDSLTIINVTDSSNPVALGDYIDNEPPNSIDDPYRVYVDTTEKIAYVVSNTDDSLTIINVSDYSNPVALGDYVDDEPPNSINGAYDIYVDTTEKIVYVVSSNNDSLTIINVSNYSNPVALGDYVDDEPPNSIDYATSVYIDTTNKIAYVTSLLDSSLTIINVSDYSNPVALGDYVDNSQPNSIDGANNVYVDTTEKIAYVTSIADDSLTIINVSNYADPVALGDYVDDDPPNSIEVPYDVYVDTTEKIAYVISNLENSLTTINVSNYSNPVALGNYIKEVLPNSIDGATSVYIDTTNKIAYVTSYFEDALTIIDIGTYIQSGTYTSEVFTRNTSIEANMINITANTYSDSGYEVEGGVLEKKMNLTDNLLAYWDFDGDDLGASTCTDIIGTHDGTIRSGSIGITGGSYDGQAYTDDGVDNNNFGCGIPSASSQIDSINDSITIFIRYKILKATSGAKMFNYGADDIQIIDNGNTYIRFDLKGRSDAFVYSNLNKYVENEWKSTMFFSNSSDTCIQSNSSTLYCEPSTGVITSPVSDIGIGGHKDGIYDPLNGSIDTLMFWNRTLSNDERLCILNEVCLTNWTESIYQPFSNGIDTNNYSISEDSNFVQAKFKLYANSTGTSILYDFNMTAWNYTAAEAEDSCTYSGTGNWDIIASDGCSIDTQTGVSGNVSCDGTGSLTINANLTLDKLFLDKNCIIYQKKQTYIYSKK